MHNIVTSSEKFSFGHVEVVFVLHVTVAEQAAAHQRIDVGGKAKRADFVDVEIRGKIAVIHAAWPLLHANASLLSEEVKPTLLFLRYF